MYFIEVQVGLIFFLVLVSIFYQVLYSGNPYQRTYLGSSEYAWTAWVSAGIAGFFGALSTLIIVAGRGGFKAVSFKNLGIVAFILFLFDFAQEASGANRRINLHHLIEGIGPYAQIDGTTNLTSSQRQLLEVLEGAGDSFTNSISAATLTIVCFYPLQLLEDHHIPAAPERLSRLFAFAPYFLLVLIFFIFLF